MMIHVTKITLWTASYTRKLAEIECDLGVPEGSDRIGQLATLVGWRGPVGEFEFSQRVDGTHLLEFAIDAQAMIGGVR